jgi:alpha-tubulin suppressor-like RCC1 family protein
MAHTVAASRDGAVYAWGCGSDGQLGLTGIAAAVDSSEGVAGGQTAFEVGDAGNAEQQKQQLQSCSSLLPVLVEHEELDHEDVVQVGDSDTE